MKRLPAILVPYLVLAASLVLAACGSSNDDKTTSTAASTGATDSGTAGAATTINVTDTGIGKVLTADNGRTVYLFKKDKSDKSTCSGECAAAWPAVTTNGKPKAGSGAKVSLLSTSTRTDGTTQVVYNGHPLYYYAPDNKKGQTTGNNVDQFGAEWYAMNGSGNEVEDKGGSSSSSSSSSSDDSSSSSSGGGYSY